MRSVTRVALQPIAQGSACILEEQQQQQAEEEDEEDAGEEDRKENKGEGEGEEREAEQVSNKRSLNIISLHHQLLLLPVDGPALRIRNVQYFSASHKDFCKAGERGWVRGWRQIL